MNKKILLFFIFLLGGIGVIVGFQTGFGPLIIAKFHQSSGVFASLSVACYGVINSKKDNLNVLTAAIIGMITGYVAGVILSVIFGIIWGVIHPVFFSSYLYSITEGKWISTFCVGIIGAILGYVLSLISNASTGSMIRTPQEIEKNDAQTVIKIIAITFTAAFWVTKTYGDVLITFLSK